MFRRDVSAFRDHYLALRESRYVPFFQPIVTLQTGQLAGFEVLARCQHPTQGIISPAHFIHEAEAGGWINELTRQILTRAFTAAALLPDHLSLSINISPVQLRHLALPQEISEIAAIAGFTLSRLIVEITESALIDNLERAGAILSGLKALGCKLALDDFGTGYSSLRHVQSLPLDELKVDQSFVGSMTAKRESRKIVSAVVGLGQSLGLTTVAEGIETREQAEMMLWLGCDLGQGYFYGRPVPADELPAAVREQRTSIAANGSSAWHKISAHHLDASPTQRLAQLQAVYDGAPVCLAFIDQKLRYVNLNKQLADLNGASIEAHLGNHVSKMIPHLFPSVEGYLRRALAGEVIREVEATIPHTGETRLLSYQPALDEAGEVIGVSLALIDITARKRAEEALRLSEAHYRKMVELDPQVLWVMDPQGRNLDISPRCDPATGLLTPESGGQNWLKSIHPDDLPPTMQSIAESLRCGRPVDVQYRIAKDPNGWQWKHSIGSPRFDTGNNIVCWYGSVQDIDQPATQAKAAAAEVPVRVSTDVYVALNPKLAEIEKRRQAVHALEIIDTPAEAEFDDLVALAAELCNAPISLISFIDGDRLWFKASVGLSVWESPLSTSFCLHAAANHGIFTIEDASQDPRFQHHPQVLGDPHLRAYAGMPLYGPNKVGIGSLCVVDIVPRPFTPAQARALNILTQQVQARLDLRATRKQLREAVDSRGVPTAV